MTSDLHCHLALFSDAELESSFGLLPEEPFALSCALSKEEFDRCVRIRGRFGFVRVSVGVHPQAASMDSEESLSYLELLPSIAGKVDAIGEVGYDLHPSNRPLEEQRFFFRRQAEIASAFSKPLVIHCRNAFDELFEDLDSVRPDVPVILHGYSGGFKYLDQAIRRGFYVSFGLPLSYPNASRLGRIAGMVPLDRILTETDCPYCLGRGVDGRSFPHMISRPVARLSEILGMGVDEVEGAVACNVSAVFGL